MERIDLVFEELLVPFFYFPKSSSDFYESIKAHIHGKVVIITDDKVKELYIHSVVENLGLNVNDILILSSLPGEKFKCFRTVSVYLDSIYEWGIDRSCLVICLGGGIPGNVGGLVAGLIYRGIAFIHIPTTIVAAFDSVISLKQAVNSSYAKNAIGMYHKPVGIYSSSEFFTTLSSREIRSGLCEAVKNVLSILPSEISRLSARLRSALDLDLDAINLVKDISIEAKQIVMQYDKLEKKKALILEYGHTVGHVIELLDSKIREDSVTHGEAVGLGMLIAAEVSYKMGYLCRDGLDTHYDILSKVGIHPNLPSGITVDKIIEYVKKDNKRGYIHTSDDQVGMVLLKELGIVNGDEDLPITPVPIKVIEQVLCGFVGSSSNVCTVI